MSHLEKTNAALKKFTGVNKKVRRRPRGEKVLLCASQLVLFCVFFPRIFLFQALDQYTHFTDQRSQLHDRKKELDSGREAIMDLIKHLDMKKDEAIERTFKTIAKHFSEVFSELVPGGKATLVIKSRALDEEARGDDEEEKGDEEEEEKGGRKKGKAKKKQKTKHREELTGTQSYSGIGIKVRKRRRHSCRQARSCAFSFASFLSLFFFRFPSPASLPTAINFLAVRRVSLR
jgi:cell division protein FtsB